MMSVWDNQSPERRTCQHCKQVRDCKRGPDPFLFHGFDEIEMVWLCADCYFLRENGLHLPELETEGEI